MDQSYPVRLEYKCRPGDFCEYFPAIARMMTSPTNRSDYDLEIVKSLLLISTGLGLIAIAFLIISLIYGIIEILCWIIIRAYKCYHDRKVVNVSCKRYDKNKIYLISGKDLLDAGDCIQRLKHEKKENDKNIMIDDDCHPTPTAPNLFQAEFDNDTQLDQNEYLGQENDIDNLKYDPTFSNNTNNNNNTIPQEFQDQIHGYLIPTEMTEGDKITENDFPSGSDDIEIDTNIDTYDMNLYEKWLPDPPKPPVPARIHSTNGKSSLFADFYPEVPMRRKNSLLEEGKIDELV